MLKEQKADYECKMKKLNKTIKVLLKEKAKRTKKAAQTHDVSEGERDALRQQSKLIYSFAPFVVTLSIENIIVVSVGIQNERGDFNNSVELHEINDGRSKKNDANCYGQGQCCYEQNAEEFIGQGYPTCVAGW